MKPIGEEQQEVTSALSDRVVVDYLLQYPKFFIRNAAQVGHIRVPYPVHGSISLVEWHMMQAHDHIHVLEGNMSLLMGWMVANKSLFQRLLQLQTRLATAGSLDDMLNRLHRWACELGLAGTTVRLFPDCWRLDTPSKFTYLVLSRRAFELIRIQRLGQAHRYLGPLNGPELLVVLPEAETIGFVTIPMLGGDNVPGVMLFNNHDVQHYRSGQGAQLLQEIARVLPGLLERWVEHA